MFDARYDYRYVLYTEMKEDTKNEMDLLLRRLGRRDDASVPGADHLDTDELSAYAENALPVAARARYTAHLAECSRCRELVVQLSSAVGVVAATETAAVSKPSAWRTFLASIFTPMVLRYAAPALGLIVVAVIGFVVLRNNPTGRYVTQVTQNDQGPPAPAAAPTDSQVYSYSSPARDATSAKTFNDKQATNKQSPAAPPPNAPPTVSSVEVDTPQDKAAQTKPEQQTAVANEPAPPKSAPSATPEERQKSADAEASKKEVSQTQAAASAPAAQRGVRAEDEKDRNTHGFTRAPADTDRVSGLATGSVAKVKRDDLSANARSVAGRRFQKKGGVWIDTAYDSSKDSMTVTRGSEQYRSLVADEPEIKTIADTLDGEIIVVWKGHTYRIH
ncbi:MAG TPA: zf-HC2 domain-containing protein [Pyrinomonadaceae bacterium]|nr:zf-HC2 domain-containing protein [Pyrinomonadaceae bacterium]